MRKFWSITLLLALTSSLGLAEAVVGKPAPAFSVQDVQGKTQDLKKYKGKIVVLENYNLDCPYVQHHYKPGAMQEVQAEAAQKGVVWLVVNSSYNDSARAKKELESQKIKATVIHDPSGKVGRAYGFKTTPHMIVIDKEGVVAYNGAIDDQPATEGNPRDAKNYVRQAIVELTSGKSVSKPQTKPYGCGAKYAE